MRKPALVIGACFALYSLLGLAWIRLPGPQQDELLFLNAALPARIGTSFLGKIQVFDWDIPSMLLPYVGALKGWIWTAIFLVWSPSIYSVRIPAVLLGGLALLLFYLWARKWYPQEIALLALALAATDPTYIYTARLDWGPVVLNHVFKFSGLLLGAKWYESAFASPPVSPRRRLFYLGAAGFCFGLGMWDKATFIWFLAALAVALLLLFPRKVLQCLRPAALAILLVSFLAGALPLLIFNYKALQKGTLTAARFEEFTPGRLANKVENLKLSLEGKSAYGIVGENTNPVSAGFRPGVATAALDFLASFADMFGNLFPMLVWLGAAVAPFLAGHRREAGFPFLIAGLMWAQMMIAKDGGFSAHHYVLSYPFPQLGVAAVAYRVWSYGDRLSRRLIATILIIVLAGQISSGAQFLRLFRETGGGRFWTDAVYDIASFVQQRQPPRLVVMDWGFSNAMRLLLQGRVSLVEYYAGPDPARLAALVHEPNVLFLFHAEGQEVFPGGRQSLQDVAARENVQCGTVRNFYLRHGHIVASLVGCGPTHTAGPARP